MSTTGEPLIKLAAMMGDKNDYIEQLEKRVVVMIKWRDEWKERALRAEGLLAEKTASRDAGKDVK